MLPEGTGSAEGMEVLLEVTGSAEGLEVLLERTGSAESLEVEAGRGRWFEVLLKEVDGWEVVADLDWFL